MPSALSPKPGPIRLGSHFVEWGLLFLVIVVLLLAFLRQARVVQGQAEHAAIKTTLGALRTAFAFNQLKARTAGSKDSVALPQRNPFELLQSLPPNYVGEINAEQAVVAGPGSWFFEPACACVGYVPLDPRWLSSPRNASMLWFRVSSTQGFFQLSAMEIYQWQGQPLD